MMKAIKFPPKKFTRTHSLPVDRDAVPCDAPEHFVDDAASNSCRIPPLDDATRQSTATEPTKMDSDESTDRLMMHLSLSIVRQVNGPVQQFRC